MKTIIYVIKDLKIQPIESNLDNDFHRYHVAILLYGFHLEDTSIIYSRVGQLDKLYNFLIAFFTPKSSNGNTSSRCRLKMRNISAVHLPIPFTLTNSFI